MANNRLIRKGFFTNPAVSKLTVEERYLLIGLTCIANDWGKFWYQPMHIRSQVFSLDKINPKKMTKMLKTIEDLGIICTYENNGELYAHFPEWREKGTTFFQRLDHPQPDVEIPHCPIHGSIEPQDSLRNFYETSNSIEQNGNEVKKNVIENKRTQGTPALITEEGDGSFPKIVDEAKREILSKYDD